MSAKVESTADIWKVGDNMLDPISIIAIGTALGAGVEAVKQNQANKAAERLQGKTAAARAAEARWSGMTGRGPSTEVQYANTASPWMGALSGGLQGAATGMALNQNIDTADLNKRLAESQIQLNQARAYPGLNPWFEQQMQGQPMLYEGQYSRGMGA
jgi:hypothetical protein